MNNKEIKNLIVFGYGLAIILAFIGTRMGIKHGWDLGPIILLSLSVFMLILTSVSLKGVEKIYKPWMKVAHLIGGTITAIMLSLMFYLIFGTVGLILRFLKKDLLDQRLDPTKTSYWIKKELSADRKRYTQQF